nr:prepilin-type N-terminal cleavage/methylation domain-containing protein [Neobacillus sp. Marseille-Q6967]
MKIIKEEKGVTLLEVLLAMTILSIVLISILNLYPQMGFVNKQNQDKAQAINIAKEILIDWQESRKVKSFLQINPTNQVSQIGSVFPPNQVNERDYYTEFKPNPSGTDYIFITKRNNFDVTIKINKSPRSEETSQVYKAHLIVVQVKKGNTTTSETYGYVKVKR